MKTKRRLLALMLAMCLLSGCNTAIFSPEAAMRSPRATGEAQLIQEALEQAVGTDIILKYPRTGQVRSAFLPHDMDGDGQNEAFAFYQRSNEAGVTRIHLLRREADGWTTVQDMEPAGTSLNTVEFCDLDGDGVDEILTGWGVANSTENLLCIYQFDDEHDRVVKRASESFTEYVVYDFDNTGVNEVAVVHLNAAQSSALLTIMDFTDVMTIVGSAKLDGSVTGYLQAQVERLENGTVALYLDAYKGPDTTVTEMVLYNGRELTNPFMDAATGTTTLTQRPWITHVQDVSGDGKLDIPFTVPLPFDSTLGLSQQSLTRWQTYDGSGYTTVLNAWYCPVDHYHLVFDKRWENEVTVLYSPDVHEAVFAEWDPSANTVGEELLRIRVANVNDLEGLDKENYASLLQQDDVVYAAKISESTSKNAMTAHQLLEAFQLDPAD